MTGEIQNTVCLKRKYITGNVVSKILLLIAVNKFTVAYP